MNLWTDVWDVITLPFKAAGAAGRAVSDTAKFAAGALAFLEVLADWHLWASIGWVLLGAGLIVMGARMWAGKTAFPALPDISVVPVPV